MASTQQSLGISPSDVHRVCNYNLSFPWFAYPMTPFSGYYDLEYFVELGNLMRYLKAIQSDKLVLHLTIGAPVEELVHDDDYASYAMHYRQLAPIHLQRAAESGYSVLNIIIAPMLPDGHYNHVRNPHFTRRFAREDSGLTFRKTANRVWECSNHNVKWKTVWFNTMMPTIDTDRNQRMMEHLRTNLKDVNINTEKYCQTSEDNEFTNYFYREFELALKNVVLRGGMVSCFNFAVFRHGNTHDQFNNCKMFKEIKCVFRNLMNLDTRLHPHQNPCISILMEWIFMRENFYVYEIELEKERSDKLIKTNYTTQDRSQCSTITVSESNGRVVMKIDEYDEDDNNDDDSIDLTIQIIEEDFGQIQMGSMSGIGGMGSMGGMGGMGGASTDLGSAEYGNKAREHLKKNPSRKS